MEFPSGRIAQLQEFGLTAHAARAYLALLELGAAEARGVSELANIPSAKVYAALAHLERGGLAQVVAGKPRKYAPVAIETFVDRQLREQEETIGQLRTRKGELIALFPLVGAAAVQERAQTAMLSGKRNILRHLREACAGAEVAIFAIANGPVVGPRTPIGRLLEQARARGVDVRVVRDGDAADAALAPAAWARAEASLIATFDEGGAMLVRLSRTRARDGHACESAIHTTDLALVRPLRRLVATAHAAQESATARDADARVDRRAFEAHLRERAAKRPARAVALMPWTPGLASDRLWLAAQAAKRARILLVDHGASPEPLRAPPNADVRCVKRASGVAYVVFDGADAFLASPPHAAGARDARFAITQDEAIVRALEDQFECRWDGSVGA